MYILFALASQKDWRDKGYEAKGSEENVWRLELDKVCVYNRAGVWGERMT